MYTYAKFNCQKIVKFLSSIATMASRFRACSFLSAFNLMTFENYLVLHQIATLHYGSQHITQPKTTYLKLRYSEATKIGNNHLLFFDEGGGFFQIL